MWVEGEEAGGWDAAGVSLFLMLVYMFAIILTAGREMAPSSAI